MLFSWFYQRDNSFQLLIDDFAGEPIDRDVEPVTLFSFDDKVSQASSSRRVTAQLRDYFDQQIRCDRLAGIRECAGDVILSPVQSADR